jgi:hypothetical protein
MIKLHRVLSGVSVTLALLVVGVAFNNTSFKGTTPHAAANPPPPPAPTPPTPTPPVPTPPVPTPASPSAYTAALICADLADPTKSIVTVHQTGSQPVKVQVEGQICPNLSENLTVLFIVDWSGSMADNDPAGADGCGRSQAAQAVLAQLKSQAAANVTIQAGMVPFSTNVDPSTILPLVGVDQFLAEITPQTFCQADGVTDYVAAFQAAQAQLANVTGRKVIYFITDGVPNVDANGNVNQGSEADPGNVVIDPTVQQDSVAAGQALLAAVPDLTVNSLLLGTEGPAAQAMVTSIAGDPSRVQLVTDATQLPTAILNFPALTLDKTSVQTVLSSPGQPDQSVQLASFAPDPTNAGVWDFTTVPLTLPGKAAGEVDSTVKLSVKGSDGQTQTAVVSVHYVEN